MTRDESYQELLDAIDNLHDHQLSEVDAKLLDEAEYCPLTTEEMRPLKTYLAASASCDCDPIPVLGSDIGDAD